MEITDRQWRDYICWTPEAVGIYRIHRDTETFKELLLFYKEFADAIPTDIMEMPTSKIHPKFKRRVSQIVCAGMETSVDKTFWQCVSRDAFPDANLILVI